MSGVAFLCELCLPQCDARLSLPDVTDSHSVPHPIPAFIRISMGTIWESLVKQELSMVVMYSDVQRKSETTDNSFLSLKVEISLSFVLCFHMLRILLERMRREKSSNLGQILLAVVSKLFFSSHLLDICDISILSVLLYI